MVNAFLLSTTLLFAAPRPDAAYTRAALRDGGGRCGGACNQMSILLTASLEQKLLRMKLEQASAADIVRMMQWELTDLKKFPLDKMEPGAREDARSIVRWRIIELEDALSSGDAEKAKKARLAQSDGLSALLARGALEAGITTDLPAAIRVADRVFRGASDADLTAYPSDFNALDLRATSAADEVATATTLLGMLKDGTIDDAGASSLYDTARRRDLPVGDSGDARARLVKGLQSVIDQGNRRLDLLRQAYAKWDAMRKEAAKHPTPSIGLPSRPMPPPAFLSPQQMVADGLIPGTGPAKFLSNKIGVGTVFFGSLNAINTGYTLGGYYENSALVNFQNSERARMREEYRQRLEDWEKNVKPLIEENRRHCEEEAKKPHPEADRIAARDARIAAILTPGMDPTFVIQFLKTVGPNAPGGGSNLPRYAYPLPGTPYRPLAPIGGGQQR